MYVDLSVLSMLLLLLCRPTLLRTFGPFLTVSLPAFAFAFALPCCSCCSSSSPLDSMNSCDLGGSLFAILQRDTRLLCSCTVFRRAKERKRKDVDPSPPCGGRGRSSRSRH